jgi:hypothetical protein
MTRRRWAFAAIAGVLGIGILVRVANHYEWGTDLPRDPSYRTGRDSVCEAPPMTGVQRPVPASRSEERPASRGLQRTVTYTIDTSTVTTGARLVVCSEYGRIRVRGSDGSRARIAVTSLTRSRAAKMPWTTRPTPLMLARGKESSKSACGRRVKGLLGFVPGSRVASVPRP